MSFGTSCTFRWRHCIADFCVIFFESPQVGFATQRGDYVYKLWICVDKESYRQVQLRHQNALDQYRTRFPVWDFGWQFCHLRSLYGVACERLFLRTSVWDFFFDFVWHDCATLQLLFCVRWLHYLRAMMHLSNLAAAKICVQWLGPHSPVTHVQWVRTFLHVLYSCMFSV